MTNTWKFWAQALCVCVVLLQPRPASAQQGPRQQYISDDVSVSVRQNPSNDAQSVGTVRSGARVSVIESLGSDSFAHIRTADGRDGWITARFLSVQPAAKDQLLELRQQLEQAHAQAQSLQRDLDTAKQQLDQARPALEMAGENDKLRADIAQRAQQIGVLEQQFDTENSRRETTIAGGLLVCGGILIGLFLPWIGARKKRRSEF